MAKTYYVIAKETCPECGGDKLIEDISYRDRDGDSIHLGGPFPKIECNACRGTGEVIYQVPLETAMKDLELRNQEIVWPENDKIKENQIS